MLPPEFPLDGGQISAQSGTRAETVEVTYVQRLTPISKVIQSDIVDSIVSLSSRGVLL